MNVMKDDKFKEGYYYKFIGDNIVKENAKHVYVSLMTQMLNGNWHKCTSASDMILGTKFDFCPSQHFIYISENYIPFTSFVECSPKEYENIKDINWEVGATYYEIKDPEHYFTIKSISYNTNTVWNIEDRWVNYTNYKYYCKKNDKEEKSDRPFKHGDNIIIIKNKDHWEQDYVGCLWNISSGINLDNYTLEYFRLATEQEKIKHSLGLKPTAKYVTKRNKIVVCHFNVTEGIVEYWISDFGSSVQSYGTCRKEDLLNHIEEDVQLLEVHATSFTEVTITLPTLLNKGEKITVCYTGYGSDRNEYKSFSHKYVNTVDKNSDSSDIEYKSFSSKYVSLIKEK